MGFKWDLNGDLNGGKWRDLMGFNQQNWEQEIGVMGFEDIWRDFIMT